MGCNSEVDDERIRKREWYDCPCYLLTRRFTRPQSCNSSQAKGLLQHVKLQNLLPVQQDFPSNITQTSIIIFTSFYMAALPQTQVPKLHSTVDPLNTSYLEGDWPILDQAQEVPAYILENIKQDAFGASISSHIMMSYLSLGYFFIHTRLLEAHLSQRPLNQHHVKALKDNFICIGIHHLENPWVIIGMGEDWNQMKKNTQKHMFINQSSPHLNCLALSPGEKIGQILCGGHQTAAITNLLNTT